MYCQPMPGANINTIMEKIELFDLTKFGNNYNLCWRK